jgi:DNA-binding NtrC family response regulator
VKGLKLLIIDDEPLMRLSMVDALSGVGCDVVAASTGTEGIYVLEKRQFDVVITDLRLPGADGLAVLKACKERSPNSEVILITAHGSVDTAMGAMKLGAYDYITKPFQMDELLLIVERVGKMFGLRRDNVESAEVREDRFSFGGVSSRNPRMGAVLERIRRMAAGHSPVLIMGELGTGKELMANAVHLNSPRKDQALVKMTCEVSEGELESGLFGHEKGAFSGAARRRRSRCELADKGTLFLDEMGGIPPGVQARLLRLIDEGRFVRIGGAEPVQVDVRVVCTTTKDLEGDVAAGRFSKDLFNRLHEMQVIVPPLRERPEDTLLMAESLVQTCSAKFCKDDLKGFSESARDLLIHYSFPGNARELEELVERAVARGQEGKALQAWDLCGNQSCPYLGGPAQENCRFCREGLTSGMNCSPPGPFTPLAEARERFERGYIVTALNRSEGSAAAAAGILGLSVKALKEKCSRYQIPLHVPDDQDRD